MIKAYKALYVKGRNTVNVVEFSILVDKIMFVDFNSDFRFQCLTAFKTRKK